MNTIASPLPTPAGRALVLGGGGSTGHAWLIGVVAGLLESGLDVTDADLVVGTSPASTAAVHVLTRGGLHLSTQVDRLRAGGSEVQVIAPRPEEDGLFGVNAMDLGLRPAAARAGHVQARALAGDLDAFWSAR